jgi:primosomal protein N' (replication factor Y)
MYADVALPLALAAPLTYAVPDDLAPRCVAGARVVVPMKRREMIGIVTRIHHDPPPAPAKARSVLAVPDDAPVLDRTLLALARHVERHYAAAPGLVLRAMLPPAVLSARRPRLSPPGRTERVLELAVRLEHLLERDARFARAPRQREAFEALERLGGRAPAKTVAAQGVSATAMRALIAAGAVRVRRERQERDPFAGLAVSAPPASLTPAQRAAVARLAELPAGGAALLFGVTGSGKTLVYLEYLRGLVTAGKGAIVLVPEIALTPQTVARFRGVFGGQVAVLHSQLSDTERFDAWRALHEGRKRVAVGPRSAVFAPVGELGVIVVDEEHDGSYKQGEAPRYHARDVALVRARLAGARVVLGSATPSLETWARGVSGAGFRFSGTRAPETQHPKPETPFAFIELPERIGARPMPPVNVVDMRAAPRSRESGAVPWSDELDRAVAGALTRGEQAMILLNRRGFSAFVQCPACGEVWDCPRCSVALTYHRSPAQLRCHHCDHRERVPDRCRSCGEPTQRYRGVGTQQVEEFVAARFPAARIARMDVDTTAGKWSHHRILDAVGRGEVDVLVGTQMIAKGLDFPNVTVVGVVDADVALNLPDFRAAERTFQLLTQVAGRAGRGPLGGRVIVQTRQPSHYAVEHAARHDVAGFAATALAERSDPLYPPLVALANCVVSGTNQRAVADAAAAVRAWLLELFASRPASRAELLGPAPCPIEKVRDRWRWHLLLKTPDAGRLTRLVGYVAARAPVGRGVRLVVDRDPVSLL